MKEHESKKKGILFERMWLPTRLTIDAQHLGNGRWEITYTEILHEDIPPEDIANTIEVAKRNGLDLKIEGHKLQYTVIGPKEQVFGILAVESIAMAKLGDLTLRELVLLAVAGMSTFKGLQGKQTKEST